MLRGFRVWGQGIRVYCALDNEYRQNDWRPAGAGAHTLNPSNHLVSLAISGNTGRPVLKGLGFSGLGLRVFRARGFRV